MLRTRFTDLVGCAVPIQQAGMGRFAQLPLAVAVASAGGLGQISIGERMDPAWIAATLDEARRQTSGAPGAIGANVLGPDPADELDRACIAVAGAHARVVDFFWADPDPGLVALAHAGGALVSWQVGSVEEAVAAERAGCDVIIAQGIEAGGHVRGHIGVLALLEQTLRAVQVPVVAAGGIGGGRALAAALAAGADGARIGTRFVASHEAHAHPVYVAALIAARPEDTVYTEAFCNGWENAPHRVLRASVEAAEAFQGDIVARRFDPERGRWVEKRPFQPFSVSDDYEGAIEATPFWAGESVASVTRIQPASGIIEEVVSEAESLLRRWA